MVVTWKAKTFIWFILSLEYSIISVYTHTGYFLACKVFKYVLNCWLSAVHATDNSVAVSC
uniref:Eukaryotic translation initiation factor 1b n=1 Tax=Pan troglodytes TaxID=9598 RepID=G2HGY8_PANTR|nr:eukaryotic translation initiation factor 1b [Pan troglodytes]